MARVISGIGREPAVGGRAESGIETTADVTPETQVRRDFPILGTRVRDGGPQLVYLDNAATTQKPQTVIDSTTHYYSAENANIHLVVHCLSEQVTISYDAVLEQARAFLCA